MFSRIVAPMVWGWIADHRESRMAVVRLASFLTMLRFSGAFFGSSFWWLAAVILLFSFFWHASLPLLEVFVMRHTASRPGAYGRVRLWGSIGFIVAVTALGPVIARGPWWVLPALLTMMLRIGSFSLTLPESEMRGSVNTRGRSATCAAASRGVRVSARVPADADQPRAVPHLLFHLSEGYGYSKTLIGLLGVRRAVRDRRVPGDAAFTRAWRCARYW
jgi:PPP family 3-phenylpropionic acid transporter